MRNRAAPYVPVIWLACAVLTSCASARSSFPTASAALVDVSVVDIETGVIRPEHMIVVAGDSILAVAPTHRGSLPAGTAVVEGAGAFAIPGLWDSHVHAFGDSEDAVDRVLPLFLSFGVTSVRDMGAEPEALEAAVTRLTARPDALAPRILASGPLLAGKPLPWYGDLPLVVRTESEARSAVSELADRGVDFFKIYEGLSPETYRAITDEADGLGIPFAGHVPLEVGLRRVADAGQRTVEHLAIATLASCTEAGAEWFGRSISAKFEEGYQAYYTLVLEFFEALESERCAADLERLAANGGHFTPTLVMELNDSSRTDVRQLDLLTDAARSWCEEVLGGISGAAPQVRESAYAAFASRLRWIRSTGVPILAGSDTPNYCLPPGASLIWELERLVEAGWTPLEAMQAATILPARAFGFADHLGKLLPGFAADIVLVRTDPTEDVAGIADPVGVMVDGRWLDEKMIEEIRQRGRR